MVIYVSELSFPWCLKGHSIMYSSYIFCLSSSWGPEKVWQTCNNEQKLVGGVQTWWYSIIVFLIFSLFVYFPSQIIAFSIYYIETRTMLHARAWLTKLEHNIPFVFIGIHHILVGRWVNYVSWGQLIFFCICKMSC